MKARVLDLNIDLEEGIINLFDKWDDFPFGIVQLSRRIVIYLEAYYMACLELKLLDILGL